MAFKFTECDYGMKVLGVNYDFTQVDSVTFTDPERNVLTRGGNGGSKTGLAYKTGVAEPKTVVVSALDISYPLFMVLQRCYKEQIRVDVYAIDKKTGDRMSANQSILANSPKQLVLDESRESLLVSIEFETFDLEVKIKDPA